MLKIIGCAAAGFVLWSILWVGGAAILHLIVPEWYGAGVKNAAVLPLLLTLLKGFVVSILAGYTAALIAKRNSPMLAALILGVMLLFVGVIVQAANWHAAPFWYHLIFLISLIPLSLLGAKLRGA